MKSLLTLIVAGVMGITLVNAETTNDDAIMVTGHGSIKGSVKDSLTGEPVITANVWVKYGDQLIGDVTDMDGKFTIKPLNPGTYTLYVSYIGYNKKALGDVQVNADRITPMWGIELGKGFMKEFIFVEYQDLIREDDPTRMTFKAAELEKNPQLRNPMTMIAGMVGGTYQQDEGQPVYFRGARSDANAYFVDGVRVRVSEGGFGIPSNSIGELNVYAGGVPAKYGDVTGGVVAITTKSYFDLYNQRNKEN